MNDDLYALGVMESSVGFYYNKDIIEEAGIEIPDGRTTPGPGPSSWISWRI